MRAKTINNIACIGGGHWGKNLIGNFNDLRALTWVCETDEKKRATQTGIGSGFGVICRPFGNVTRISGMWEAPQVPNPKTNGGIHLVLEGDSYFRVELFGT